MRKIAEIRKDLNAKVAEVKALDPKANAEALAEGLRVIDELLAELRAAEAVERAEQAVAEERLANMERKAGRRTRCHSIHSILPIVIVINYCSGRSIDAPKRQAHYLEHHVKFHILGHQFAKQLNLLVQFSVLTSET